MSGNEHKSEAFDFIGAFEQGWIQYKANLFKLIPFGILAAIPPTFFSHSVLLGAILTLVFEGFFLLLLVDAINACNNLEKPLIFHRIKENWLHYFKEGAVISIFMFPLLVLGFFILVIPSILIFAVFIFSFSQVVVKNKFGIDACMESLRQGYGYRLPIFLLSLIFYATIILIYILTEYHPIFFTIIAGFSLPYFYAVVQEFFEQLEIK